MYNLLCASLYIGLGQDATHGTIWQRGIAACLPGPLAAWPFSHGCGDPIRSSNYWSKPLGLSIKETADSSKWSMVIHGPSKMLPFAAPKVLGHLLCRRVDMGRYCLGCRVWRKNRSYAKITSSAANLRLSSAGGQITIAHRLIQVYRSHGDLVSLIAFHYRSLP